MTLQDDTFRTSEGDAWFRRNRAALGAAGHDWPLHVLGFVDGLERLRSVAEVGCSNGFRLAALRAKLPGIVRAFGVDASQAAIEDGRARFPGIDLRHGVAATVEQPEPFDLVVVNYVLHWIDRATLARSLAGIDGLVADGGLLVLGDFLPDYPQRRRYHHLPDQQVFTFKQDYARTFEALGTYREVARLTYDHDAPGAGVKVASSGARGFCALLRKSLGDYYPEV